MKLIEGTIPEGKRWRVLLTLSPGQPLGKTWQLARALARANGGELVVAITIPDGRESQIQQAHADVARIRAASDDDGRVHTLIVEAAAYDKELGRFVEKADIDLLLTYAEDPNWRDLKSIPCAVGIVRGDRTESDEAILSGLKRIIVPTSGGPNTAHALSFLLPLTPAVKVQALYIVPASLGHNEAALGRARLQQLLNVIDAGDRIQTQLVTSPSVIDGIVDAASEECDLVVIGASRESSLDKALFGDIPGAVVRQSKRPILIVRQPHKRLENLMGNLSWQLANLKIRLSLQERTAVYARIRRSARPDADYFILIALSAMIAALGLLVNSPAVVIGAMLVAPLMSPIVGAGLAMVLGDTRFLRLSLGAVIRGVGLAVLVGAMAGALRLDTPLTAEILARTQPTLLDLAIALFSGMAGAYALSHSDAAGALPGVAIAAALVPPLSTVGITLITGHYRESFGAAAVICHQLHRDKFGDSAYLSLAWLSPDTGAKSAARRRRFAARASLCCWCSLLLCCSPCLLTRLAQDAWQEAETRALVIDKGNGDYWRRALLRRMICSLKATSRMECAFANGVDGSFSFNCPAF